MTSTLTTRPDGALIWRTPYNAPLVQEFKARVPGWARQWDAASKAWTVAATYAQTVCDLTARHLGQTLSIPASAARTVQVSAHELRYIGQTKPRGNGWDAVGLDADGQWSLVFPEAVLRAWFANPVTPSDATTLYAVLSIQQEATADEIKKAYRRLARQWHPDVCCEPDAESQFKRINHANAILSDPDRRARYDAGLALAATLAPDAEAIAAHGYYRPPLRCGYVLVTGFETMGRVLVSSILAWEDITNAAGQVLSVSWPAGADAPVEFWV